MKINWFPGHMKKTLAEMEMNIKKVDGVIYVLDSRAPLSCINPQIDVIVQNKPVLYILSKADLSCEKSTKTFIRNMTKQGKTVLSLNLNTAAAKNELINSLTKMLKEKRQKFYKKEITHVFKIMIIGVPNTGKSTLINNLSFTKKATTGDKAGVTKSTQWVKVNDELALLDTPGTLWPSMKDEMVSLKLAFIGSIKDDILDTTELGFELIKFLIRNNLQEIQSRFPSVDFSGEPIEIYDAIGKARGYLLRGGDIDYERLGKAVLVDFRSGRMGRITLDKVDEHE